MATLYPMTPPYDKISLVLQALRGQVVTTAQVVKAAWEVGGYGFSLTLGDPDGPQKLVASQEALPLASAPLTKDEAIAQLETALKSESEPEVEVQEGVQQFLLPIIGQQLAIYLLQWALTRLLMPRKPA